MAGLLPSKAYAQSSLEQKVAKAYGFDNDLNLNEKLRDVATVMARLNCGSAMTVNACRATNRFFIIELQRNPAKVRADLMVFLSNRYAGNGGLKAALHEARRSPDASGGCGGAATLACKTLIDFFFAGGVIEPLKAARQKAAKVVRPFYKDGRPFDG